MKGMLSHLGQQNGRQESVTVLRLSSSVMIQEPQLLPKLVRKTFPDVLATIAGSGNLYNSWISASTHTMGLRYLFSYADR